MDIAVDLELSEELEKESAQAREDVCRVAVAETANEDGSLFANGRRLVVERVEEELQMLWRAQEGVKLFVQVGDDLETNRLICMMVSPCTLYVCVCDETHLCQSQSW